MISELGGEDELVEGDWASWVDFEPSGEKMSLTSMVTLISEPSRGELDSKVSWASMGTLILDELGEDELDFRR